MIIATRSLVLRENQGNARVPIRVYAPETKEDHWICRFEIEWPEGRAERWGTGSDAIQALLIALQMIGSEIYASRYHEAGRLSWLTPGKGYGFPVAQNIRDFLIGDDKRFL